MGEIDKELAELENQINQKKEEEQKAEPIPEPEKEPEKGPEPELPKDDEKPAPEPSGENGFNATDWVKKKGWKSAEDAAKSMRELEKAFHEKSQEINRLKENQGYQPPAQPYQPQGYAPPPPPPPMPNYGYQGGYNPPANPYAPSQPSEEEIAASYGLSVDDFRKVMRLSRDVSEIQSRQMAADYQRWKEEQERNNEKNSDMANVLGDPAFHNASVQYEMHEIMTKNPSVWSERRPYTAALKEALINIGRKNMIRGNSQPEMGLPSTPPSMAGSRGSYQPGRRIGSLPPLKDIENKTPEEIEKMLKSVNAVKTYQDMM